MHITWYGAAGFRIETGGRVFLIDPLVSRSPAARPRFTAAWHDVAGASEIFLSHGHFDHAADVPRIARQTGATVYTSSRVARALAGKGVDPAQITVASDGDCFDCGVYRAQPFASTHVRFDAPLVAKALWRARSALAGLLPLVRAWPRGQVLAWRFTLVAEAGRVVQHFGSAEREFARLAEMAPPDVLLVPLQGRSDICRIAARVVARLRPHVAIPHHHDDFWPPLSQMVDIVPFVEAVAGMTPPVQVQQLPIGERVEL